ncbi:MAG: hypothetical protein KBC49_04045 [Candidatus Pacebacteria bacterium]|nr:hypothetical protein [Candidatus Paceibacterota bacterium]
MTQNIYFSKYGSLIILVTSIAKSKVAVGIAPPFWSRVISCGHEYFSKFSIDK